MLVARLRLTATSLLATTTTNLIHDVIRRIICVGLLALVAAGCGGNGNSDVDATSVLSETAAKLGDLRSGKLDLRLTFAQRGRDAERIGFALRGLFALRCDSAAPCFDLEYTQIRGNHEETMSVTAIGGRAFVSSGNETYELPPDRARKLIETGAALGGGLGELDLRSWLPDPELSDGERIAGDATDRLEGELDVAAAAHDVLALARKLEVESLGPLSGVDEKGLASATERATIRMWTGEDDRQLRRLDLHLEVDLAVPDALGALIGGFVGGDGDLELTVERPNETVSVEAPAHAHPPSEFPGT